MIRVVKRCLPGLWRCCCGVRTLASSSGHCRDQPPFNVLFLGTDSFALETLKALHLDRTSSSEKRVVEALHVVSTSMKTPVADFARAHDLTLLTWPPALDDLDFYDLGVLVSFGRMVPRKIIAKFAHGILNVHPSLLPRWRGASPILHTVLNADKETGVSIMSIRPAQFDTGPVVLQERTAIPQDVSAQSLADTLAVRGADLLLTTLRAMPDVLTRSSPQPDTGVTYAHKLTSAVAWVDWEHHGQHQVRQQYLALHHKWPLRSRWQQQTVKLLDMVLDSGHSFTSSSLHPAPPQTREEGEKSERAVEAGAVTFDPQLQAVCVKCVDGWVAFRSVILRKPMSAVDFYNGYLSKDKQPHVHFQSVANGLLHHQYWDFVHQRKVSKS